MLRRKRVFTGATSKRAYMKYNNMSIEKKLSCGYKLYYRFCPVK